MHRINDSLSQLKKQIQASAARAGRNAKDITLLGVSKKQSDDKIIAAIEAGLEDFGENYLQESLSHIELAQSSTVVNKPKWHFIGPIQSNKTRAIAENFAWVHSVDRLKIAQRLSEQRSEALGKLQVCLQVNIDGEASKAGASKNEVAELCLSINQLPHLQLRGLMIIPRARNNYDEQRQVFAQARELMQKINRDHKLTMDTLSMGMSADMDAAIAEGATIVRIGSALFGARS
ncbi:YggS family pyridoxal phosphate-dependent enzyme [Agaribacterium sp. ZY112]|uniref:YggS family pyridoxal phosphate-dependent enzyme n=1 Tax=Agaribacterium sp. ZY112 TaxID=3233574 RepID=UPI00352650B5